MQVLLKKNPCQLKSNLNQKKKLQGAASFFGGKKDYITLGIQHSHKFLQWKICNLEIKNVVMNSGKKKKKVETRSIFFAIFSDRL